MTLPTMTSEFLQNYARSKLWQKADIGSWYLYDYQKEIHQWLKSTYDPFLEAARQIGKTTTIATYCQELSIAKKHHVTRWCEPFKNQAREIIMPEMDKQCETAPEELRPKWTATDSYYDYPNDSKMFLRGVNEDKGKSARGSFADIVVADEYGFWTEPAVLNRVLKPQLRTRRKFGAKCIVASTPPEDLGHPYYEERERARRQGRFKRVTILDIGLSEAEIEKIAEDHGGWEHPDFRREFLCEDVADPNRVVVPEYNPDTHDVDDDYPRPDYYTAYVGCDLGFSDFTGLVFLYFDFKTQEVVIEDEICVAGWNSKDIVSEAIGKEKSLGWVYGQPAARWSDNDQQILFDMLTLHGYAMSPVQKAPGYKFAAINELRLRFSMGKIKIKKRCKNLRHQLKVGMWNTNKTSFARADTAGHLDMIDALVYAHKNIDFRLNPWPKFTGTAHSHLFLPSEEETASERALEKAFSNPFQDK